MALAHSGNGVVVVMALELASAVHQGVMVGWSGFGDHWAEAVVDEGVVTSLACSGQRDLAPHRGSSALGVREAGSRPPPADIAPRITTAHTHTALALATSTLATHRSLSAVHISSEWVGG